MTTSHRVTRVVFLSLVLDLFAFTIPLPLFPRIIEWYRSREISNPNGFLSRTLRFVSHVRAPFYEPSLHSARVDVVLLGGLMGSIFSTLQFLVSPKIGSLSDRHGRKKVLLWTLVGNILSAVVWLQSTSFLSYIMSRVIGGLSEGNVQLANAIISDVTPPSERSKALSSVGIAFAICFCIGPPIGAYFATRPLPSSLKTWGVELNVYALPALLTLVLLLLETAYVVVALPETRGSPALMGKSKDQSHNSDGPSSTREHETQMQDNFLLRLNRLKVARRFHFIFLSVFSGVEFTLTFLTFDLFDWSNKKNGALIGGIGIASGLFQRGYVRSAMSKVGEDRMARLGVASCAAAFALLALIPQFVMSHRTVAIALLHAAALFTAVTSATVVTSLTAYSSLQCDPGYDKETGKPHEQHPELVIGKAMGHFRSWGQAGRAIGPLIACASYWTFGPSRTYAVSSIVMFLVMAHMNRALPRPSSSPDH